ncbi:MAG: CorA family divalent cation transporter [Akkermansiaceae bacterium]|nr:CorA family divalent cation transporter [Akkermansiaceae bacterium]
MARRPRDLPAHFELEPELLDQLTERPGFQRCFDGEGELLLVVHDLPVPGVPERQPVYFWKRADDVWMQSSGEGLGEFKKLLDRYAQTIDDHELQLEQADSASDLFPILRHSGPISRSLRNMAGVIEQVLQIDTDDREFMALRDRVREIDRAAELLHLDAKMELDFLRAEQAEIQAESTERLNHIAFRLNLLAGFFLPLVAFAGLFGMNVDLPAFIQPMFWGIFFGGLAIGLCLLYLVGYNTGSLFKLPKKGRKNRQDRD